MRRLTTSTETPRRAWARSLRELSWRGCGHPRTRCGLWPALARGITTVSLPPGALAGANDLPNGSSEYAYDANGNMASDSGRGITSVAYDRLNLPRRIACKDGTVVAFKYDALGRKLAETDSVPLASIVRPLTLKPFPGGVVGPSIFDKGEKFSYNQSYKGHRINIISYKVYNSIISANPGKTIKKRHN